VSDLKKYIDKCKREAPDEFANYDEEYETFKVGVLLKQARQQAGLTQKQVAEALNTHKSVISRMENHASDVRLSTLDRFAQAVGKKLTIAIE
jgi:HTH-type transcriptional regulator / antitoxin HipB